MHPGDIFRILSEVLHRMIFVGCNLDDITGFMLTGQASSDLFLFVLSNIKCSVCVQWMPVRTNAQGTEKKKVRTNR